MAGMRYLVSPFRVDDLAGLLESIVPRVAPSPVQGRMPPVAEQETQKTIEPPDRAARPQTTAPPEKPEKYKILAVDDDRIIRRLYERVLTEVGYEVLLAEDGEDAWQKIASFAPDLVISDVEMPRVDGYELCRRVKEYPQWAQTPFIICSSLSGGRDVMRAFESGTDDYLIKPINEDELLGRVAEMLASIEQGGRELILVVDDSRIVRNLVRGGLVKQGFEVETAMDGLEALDKLEAMVAMPSMIISDFEMPRMNGFELGMELRNRPQTKGIPLIVMSARDDKRYKSLMKTAGAVGYIGKPFEPDKVVALVERVLAEQRLKAEKARIRELVADDAMAQTVREIRLGKRSVAKSESMTLLFSDLKGFSTMCTRLSAETVVELLNGYFDAMIPAIQRNQGDVDKFIGDAIMARFRDPEEEVRDPSPLRAIRAALDMQQALREYNRTQPGDQQLHMRIGINHGQVVIGSIGAKSRRDFTTIGDEVNRAQRLESNARVDGICIAENTYQLVRDRVIVEPRESLIQLKGIDQPVQVYDVLGIRP
jgi:CheY-like chemotaxis protein